MTSLVQEMLDTPLGKIQLLRLGGHPRGGGGGEPLVYLHSAAGETTHAALEDLAGDHAVFVPVFPGFGSSEGIERIDDMEDAVFHLLDVLDLLGLGAPVVMGLSLGAWMAAELATRAPERVGRLILVSPVGLHIEGAPVAQLFGRSPGELAEDLYADQSHPMAQMMHSLSEWVGDPTRMVELPMELLLPLWQSMSATAKVGWNPYLHNPKLGGRLRRVTAPTLVVAGSADRFLPRAHPEAFAAGIPGARLLLVDGAGHMVPLERPVEFTAAVRQFLA
jgi:pimeloyl-ACP methyl ester carboxylesterase